MKKLAVVFTFMLMIGLAACAPAGISVTRAALEPQESSPPPTAALQTPVPTQKPVSRLPISEGLLLTEFDDRSGTDLLGVVDPLNGFELAGFDPLPLGASSAYVKSPDGKSLALLTYPAGNPPNGASLALVNLQDWTVQKIDLGLNDWISTLDYAQDGRLIAIAASQANGQLLVVDVQQGRILSRRETGLSLRKLKFSPDGAQLMVYGVPGEVSTEVSSGDPVAGLLDVKDLSWLWRVSLPGVRDGVYRVEGKSGDLHTPGNAERFAPGLVFSPVKQALYVVNAEKEELINVDFEQRALTSLPIRPELSWLEQLLSLGASAAQAKGMAGNEKSIVIAPDGSFLYVLSIRNEMKAAVDGGSLEFIQIPQGLQIIRSSDAVETGRLETQASDMAISANGKSLYLHLWGSGEADSRSGTDIFDTSEKIIVDHQDDYLTPTRLVNGQPALVSQYLVGDHESRLAVFESESARLRQSWSTSSYASWLIFP
jgi:hypothetical protein